MFLVGIKEFESMIGLTPNLMCEVKYQHKQNPKNSFWGFVLQSVGKKYKTSAFNSR
jgi:hypothetical protein